MKSILIFILFCVCAFPSIAQKSVSLYAIPYLTNKHYTYNSYFRIEKPLYDIGYGINYTRRIKQFYYDVSLERLKLGTQIPKLRFSNTGTQSWNATHYSSTTIFTNWTLRLSGGNYLIRSDNFQGGISLGMGVTYCSNFENIETFFLVNNTTELEIRDASDVDINRLNIAISVGLPMRWQWTDKLGLYVHFLYQILATKPSSVVEFEEKLYSWQCNFGVFRHF